MKAALNGVPSLSTLDGWWVEGFVDGVTGWTIPTDERLVDDPAEPRRPPSPCNDVLGSRVLPTYYSEPYGVLPLGRSSIVLNGSFFSAQRMVDEYAGRAYGLGFGFRV